MVYGLLQRSQLVTSEDVRTAKQVLTSFTQCNQNPSTSGNLRQSQSLDDWKPVLRVLEGANHDPHVTLLCLKVGRLLSVLCAR